MAPTPQFTAVQIFQAAQRAEAEGRTDYALQFYRHIFEHYKAEPEAVEARNSFHRLSQPLRLGHARDRYGPALPVAATASGYNDHGGEVTTVAHANGTGGQRPPPLDGRPSAGQDQGRTSLPQVVTRSAQLPVETEPEFAFKDRYRPGTVMAQGANWLGWIGVGVGTALAIAGLVGAPQALAAPGLFGLPSGVVHGLQASAAGLALVFLSQLALAVFDNANATRNLLAIERAKADL